METEKARGRGRETETKTERQRERERQGQRERDCQGSWGERFNCRLHGPISVSGDVIRHGAP